MVTELNFLLYWQLVSRSLNHLESERNEDVCVWLKLSEIW